MRKGLLPLRGNRKGVAPVFAEMLMVLTMVVMAVSVYFMFNALSENAANIPTAVTFRSAGTEPASVPGYCCLNDTTVEIIATLGDPQIWAPTLEYSIVSDTTGELLVQGYLEQEPTNASEIYLGVYQGSDTEPSIINIWYTDVDRNGIVSVSDHISLRGMSKEFHQALFRVVSEGRTIGTQFIE